MLYKIGQIFLNKWNGWEYSIVPVGTSGFCLISHADGCSVCPPMKFEIKDGMVDIPDDSQFWVDEITGMSHKREDFQLI